jgi:hypothetical protein
MGMDSALVIMAIKGLKKVFRNPVSKWFIWDIADQEWAWVLANYLSRRSRAQTGATKKFSWGKTKNGSLYTVKKTLAKKKY